MVRSFCRHARCLAVLLVGVSLARAQGVVNPSLLAPLPEAASAANARETGSRTATRKAQGAVVQVAVEVDGPRGKFLIERPSTGVVVGDGSHVITWTRLVSEVEGASDKRLVVQWPEGGGKAAAQVVRSDAGSGLSLLRLAAPEAGAQALKVAPIALEPGLPITVIGCPEGSSLVAFEGVLSMALADVVLAGRNVAKAAVALTDARADARCDGAAVVDERGHVVGLVSAEHVRRDVAEPTLADLQQPSFLVVLGARAMVEAFATELGAGVVMADAPANTGSGVGAVAAASASIVGVYGGAGAWPVANGRDPGASMRTPAIGSGVLVAAPGLIVTNNHLVPEEQAHVMLPDGTRLPATVQKRHRGLNLALLSVPAGSKRLPILPARVGEEMVLGERIVAVGRPFGVHVVASAGVLSAVRGGGRMQADPDLGNANAGGAVVDHDGNLIGIVDGGALDPLAVAFAMRGDRVTKETNLSTFVGIEQVRRVFSDEFAAAASVTVEFDRGRVTNALTRMVDQVAPALLNVYVGSTSAGDESSNPFASVVPSEARVFGLGSGVIIDRSGLALSNWHVVDEAVFPDGAAKPGFSVEVSVFGGRKYAVQVLSISRENDLALLQLELQPGESVHALELGNSAALEIGEKVVAIGNPHGKANTITAGIVTAKDQGIRVRGRWAKLEHLIETDAAINGGNSGGALLDMTGRLVGINSAGGGTFNNRGYAISVDHVRRQLLGLLLQAYKLRSPDLGMAVADDDGKVVVSLVDARGPAAHVGVRSGDRVLSFAGEAITWSPGMARVLLRQKPDVPVPLVLERQGQQIEVQVTPMAPGQWALIRQSGLACRDLPFAEAPEQVRAAAIAAHRKFTGDRSGEPAEIPAQLLRIEAVHAGIQKAEVDLRSGDLLVAVMLRDTDTGGDVLVHITGVEALKRLFNDRVLGDYDGQQFRCWIARAGAIHEVDLLAKRLFW